MAIRPEICGFNLQKFLSIFGSKNEVLLKERLEQDKHDVLAYRISSKKDTLTKLIMTNEADLAAIEESDPDLIKSFIADQEDILTTDSSIWRYYHMEYFEQLVSKLSPEMRKLFEFFIYGRMFFQSDAWTTSELPYSYLTLDEVKIILVDMDQQWDIYDDAEGFGKELKTWLTSISEKNLDLFFDQG